MGRRGDWVIPHETQRLSDLYDVGEELGYGRYGTTYLCVEKSTGARHACKSIEKGKLPRRKHYESVWREIKVMHHLSEQEAVVGIRGAYEDDTSVHIVMELCSGGELYHGILKKGHYTERKAARLIRIIVGMVEACHSLGVMHRDLKPENFLFVGEDDDHSALKAIDFGLSIFFQPGNIYKDVVGSPYYVAPEVLRKSYGPEVDIWSAGVILYILLCGVPPFWGEAEPEIFKQVLFGPLDFESEPWPRVSESAKDLIRNMLNRNPTKRFTAHEVLSHPWMAVDDNVAPDRPLDPAVFSRLKRFSPMNRLKKMALRVMAERLAEEEIGGLKELFKTLDTENSGSITFEELKRGLQRVGSHLTESEIRALVDGVDMNGSGAIDHVEFIAATLHANKIEEEQNLISAFYFFDRDRSGYITIDQLQRACREMDLHDAHLHELIREIDQNNDGKVDYGEFAAMMRSNDRGERGRRKKNGNND